MLLAAFLGLLLGGCCEEQPQGGQCPEAQADAAGSGQDAQEPDGVAGTPLGPPNTGPPFPSDATGFGLDGSGGDLPDSGAPGTGSPWQNPRNRFDVNDDGAVRALDVLDLINRINAGGSGPLPAPGPAAAPPPYYDVDGDNSLTPSDVLAVLNHINQSGG